MSQGSLNQRIRFLGQKVCSVARVQTDRQTDTKVNTEDTLSGFQELFLSTYHQGSVQKKAHASLDVMRNKFLFWNGLMSFIDTSLWALALIDF